MYSARRGTSTSSSFSKARTARPLVEQRADVLERVDVADGLVVVGVLAELLDAAVEVAEDRVEVDDLLAVELEDDPQHAVGRRVLRAHVDEHLAVAERVELAPRARSAAGTAGSARRRRASRSSMTRGSSADWAAGGGRHGVGRASSAGAVRRTSGRRRGVARGVRSAPSAGRRRPASAPRRRAGRSPCAAGSSGSRAACRSGAGRGCPRSDAEHVVGLALHPLGALPQEGDRRDARVVARQAVGDDPQPVRGRRRSRGGRRPA